MHETNKSRRPRQLEVVADHTDRRNTELLSIIAQTLSRIELKRTTGRHPQRHPQDESEQLPSISEDTVRCPRHPFTLEEILTAKRQKRRRQRPEQQRADEK